MLNSGIISSDASCEKYLMFLGAGFNENSCLRCFAVVNWGIFVATLADWLSMSQGLSLGLRIIRPCKHLFVCLKLKSSFVGFYFICCVCHLCFHGSEWCWLFNALKERLTSEFHLRNGNHSASSSCPLPTWLLDFFCLYLLIMLNTSEVEYPSGWVYVCQEIDADEIWLRNVLQGEIVINLEWPLRDIHHHPDYKSRWN